MDKCLLKWKDLDQGLDGKTTGKIGTEVKVGKCGYRLDLCIHHKKMSPVTIIPIWIDYFVS